MTKPKICICTLGCKVNQYDSDAMAAVFAEAGMEVAEGFVPADIYIVNTCAVTAEAERKSRQAVNRISRMSPGAEIYVCGCASQNDFSQFGAEGVRYIGGTKGKFALAEAIVARCEGGDAGVFGKICASDFSTAKAYEEGMLPYVSRTRRYIKVQDGCNNFCSYCIVPYLRGRSRSRSLSGVLEEVRAAEVDSREVVLTGINLSAYGRDIGTSLAALLTALQSTPLRVRLGSLEVRVIDEAFLEAAAGMKSFCPHFHLSLQSGDDGVLRDMNRHYTAAEYAEKVALIREKFPGAAVTTDVIVGFPTETDEAFERSLAFCAEMSFADMHVFPYSSRKGTAAGKLRTLDPRIVAEREKKMLALKRERSEKFRLSVLGKPAEVLFETREDGMWCGHTPEYVKVYASEGARGAVSSVVPTALFGDGVRV